MPLEKGDCLPTIRIAGVVSTITSHRFCCTFVGRVILFDLLLVFAAHKCGTKSRVVTETSATEHCGMFVGRRSSICMFTPSPPPASFTPLAVLATASQKNPQLVQFLRLLCLSGEDSFLLETIFRQEVWEFMEEPVSQNNEKAVNEALSTRCVSPFCRFMLK